MLRDAAELPKPFDLSNEEVVRETPKKGRRAGETPSPSPQHSGDFEIGKMPGVSFPAKGPDGSSDPTTYLDFLDEAAAVEGNSRMKSETRSSVLGAGDGDMHAAASAGDGDVHAAASADSEVAMAVDTGKTHRQRSRIDPSGGARSVDFAKELDGQPREGWSARGSLKLADWEMVLGMDKGVDRARPKGGRRSEGKLELRTLGPGPTGYGEPWLQSWGASQEPDSGSQARTGEYLDLLLHHSQLLHGGDWGGLAKATASPAAAQPGDAGMMEISLGAAEQRFVLAVGEEPRGVDPKESARENVNQGREAQQRGRGLSVSDSCSPFLDSKSQELLQQIGDSERGAMAALPGEKADNSGSNRERDAARLRRKGSKEDSTIDHAKGDQMLQLEGSKPPGAGSRVADSAALAREQIREAYHTESAELRIGSTRTLRDKAAMARREAQISEAQATTVTMSWQGTQRLTHKPGAARISMSLAPASMTPSAKPHSAIQGRRRRSGGDHAEATNDGTRSNSKGSTKALDSIARQEHWKEEHASPLGREQDNSAQENFLGLFSPPYRPSSKSQSLYAAGMPQLFHDLQQGDHLMARSSSQDPDCDGIAGTMSGSSLTPQGSPSSGKSPHSLASRHAAGSGGKEAQLSGQAQQNGACAAWVLLPERQVLLPGKRRPAGPSGMGHQDRTPERRRTPGGKSPSSSASPMEVVGLTGSEGR